MTTTNTENLLAPLAFRADAKQRSVKTASAHSGRVLLMLLLALFTATQAAMAETVTYTISGDVEGNGNVNFSVSASGDATGSAGAQWSFTGASASGNISVPGGITMSFGSDKTSSMAVSGHLMIKADGDTGGYFTLRHASKYIYHITLKKTGGDVIQEAWNITKSYTYRFKEIELQTIVVDYADAIPITGAAITGLNSQYPVSDTAVTPTPTVTWHGTTLISGTHYTFSYQNNTAPGTATVKATGTGSFSSGTSVSADYTLVWATYSVSFNKNNAAATGTMANQDFTYSIAQALTANAFVAPFGYAFAGWSEKANGTVVYADKQEVKNLTATDGATFNLYAQWALITYTLRLHHNDGTDDYTDMTMTYGQAQNIQSVSHAGFNFTGWNTAADGSGTAYADGQSVQDLTATQGEVIHLYAQWAVTYIAADGTEQTVDDFTILSDATIPINSDNWGTIGTSGQEIWYVATGSYTFEHDRLNARGHVHLILADGAVFNVNGNMYGISGSDLTIYGQRQGTGQLNASTRSASSGQGAIHVARDLTIYDGTVSTTTASGVGITASNNVTIHGGTVSTTAVSGDGIYASNNVTIHGGTVNANGASRGIYARMGNIILGWSKASDRITASRYNAHNGTVSVKDGQTFYDGTDSYSGTLSDDDLYAIAGKTLQPCLALADAESNTAAIAAQSGKAIAVALQGRTLYKDGSWNTLCLPFDVTLSGSVLDGNNVQAMTLNTSTSGISGSTLTLNFTQVSPSGEQGGLIPAGTPFIIKWDGDGSTNITSPVFAGVTIDDTPRDATVEGVVTFTGTYTPFSIGDGGDNTVLYLGAANTLYYPTNAMTIGSQRAYFQLLGGLTAGEPTSPQQNAVSAVALNFFDEEASGIVEVKADADLKSASRESGISNPLQREWYTLDGRRLSGKPAQGGVYVVGGRKVVVK